MKNKIKISVVSPVYKAEKIVDKLCEKLICNLKEITENFEIILIDDCSPDESWLRIQENAKIHNEIDGIKLSRNFGQHHAITAGIDQSRGDWVVVMDCDLQDKPEEIINLYKEACRGYDIVLAARKNRTDGFLKRSTSRLFYWLLSFFSGLNFNGDVGNFGIYNKKVIDSIKILKEPFRFFVSSVKWVGFKATTINVKHDSRYEGKSSYNFKKLFSLAVNIIISYSNKPLKFMTFTGLSFSFISILFIIYNVYLKYTNQITELGYTSIISSIWLLSGIILISTGILGIYIGKVYDGIKNRPLYIISDRTNSLK